MSNDNSSNGQSHERRGSVTSAAFSNLFHRSNSVSASGNGSGGRESVSAAAARDQRRRLSVTTLGLSGSSPSSATTPFGIRRGSISTNYSDSIDENAIDDDEPAKMPTTSPFARRTSFGAQAMRNMRTGQTSPGSGRPTQRARRTSFAAPRPSPPSSTSSFASRRMSVSQASNTLSARTASDMLSARSDNGYNWTEQLRSRAESSVTGHRPAFGPTAIPGSPPRPTPHDRAKSVSDMPTPPRQPEVMKSRQPERPKPDYMQERILKGDFYMD
ncbi:hypothetical protein F5B22DRAFT_637809 [Xylaria bambusicola]|uniref:uncharacterized protein n=1 Tax=Xylaria bambusicola TaxID=326684 RepID=UPI002008A6C5|nr:uncharacterized protein F5B22DRAFT_637809 [Xylaria bambusicola]KAI0512563.1 hypothetical protein F5B22DRAFT_637809 [Xylaria bambusicola]